jgi:hypothetical protein
MRFSVIICLGMSVLALTPACDGKDDEKEKTFAKPFDTTLQDSKALSALTEKENRQLCKELTAWQSATAEANANGECRRRGVYEATLVQRQNESVTDVELRASCQKEYEACIDGEGWRLSQVDCSESVQFPAECQATIGELADCYNEQDQSYKTLLQNMPECQSLPPTLPPSEPTEELGPKCQVIESKCAIIFGK